MLVNFDDNLVGRLKPSFYGQQILYRLNHPRHSLPPPPSRPFILVAPHERAVVLTFLILKSASSLELACACFHQLLTHT